MNEWMMMYKSAKSKLLSVATTQTEELQILG